MEMCFTDNSPYNRVLVGLGGVAGLCDSLPLNVLERVSWELCVEHVRVEVLSRAQSKTWNRATATAGGEIDREAMIGLAFLSRP